MGKGSPGRQWDVMTGVWDLGFSQEGRVMEIQRQVRGSLAHGLSSLVQGSPAREEVTRGTLGVTLNLHY